MIDETFETELAGLVERHGKRLTDNQIITGLERALDEALVLAGEPEASKVRCELLAALKLAEDVLSRFPYSTEIWPDGTHPNSGITQIRAAVAMVEGRRYDCTICGGLVDLSNPIKPTTHVGRGGKPEPQPNPPVDMLGQPAPTLSEWRAKE